MATPKQSDPQFKLRLTHALRDQIETAAAGNNRSMNAEIVDRLERSFDSSITSEKLNEIVARFETQAGEIPSARTIYVVLDAAGRPVSWQEIFTHLGFIGRAAGGDIQSIDARIFDAEAATNNDREKEWLKLLNFYRRQNTKLRREGKETK